MTSLDGAGGANTSLDASQHDRLRSSNRGRLGKDDSDPEAGLEQEKQSESSKYPRHVTIWDRIDHFTWAWFTLPMSTGGIALLLSLQPHTFHGLLTIGKIIFIFDLLLFIVLTCLITTRFVRNPHKLRASLTHLTESLFFPTFFLALPTIIGCMHNYGVPVVGDWLNTVLRVLFWLYAAVTFLVAIFQYLYLFTGKHLTVQSMTPSWLLPIFPVMLCGTIASIIAPSQPVDQRLSIIVAGATFQGLGFWTAIVMYPIYIGRLMQDGLPDADLRPGMFIAVGPPSFTGLALIGMARSVPAGYGYFAVHPTATETVQTTALIFAIFIWTLGCWFFFISACSVVMVVKDMQFHLVWWAFIFPNSGFTIAVINIGNALGSPGIRWLGTAMSILLVAGWLAVLVFHTRAVYRGDIMWPGKDEDKGE